MSVKLGYFATHLHDFPEPHGTLYFDEKPEVGDTTMCPITEEEFRVTSVNHRRMEINVKLCDE